MTRYLIALLCVFTFQIAQAHEAWIEREGQTVKVFFGEPGQTPESGEALQPLMSARLEVGDEMLDLSHAEDHLAASTSTQGVIRLVADEVWDPWKTDDGEMQAGVIYARHGLQETQAQMAFEFTPVADADNRFQLMFRGEPLAGHDATLVAGGEPDVLETDDQGRVAVPAEASGQMMLIATKLEEEPQSVGGQEVASVWHMTTLTFDN